MEYEKMYEQLGFIPANSAICPDTSKALEAKPFEVFTLLKHLPEKFVAHTSEAHHKAKLA